ncbi:MAG: hypothetical protein NXI31_08295 [bacterium]|nr:hypothetical protein [bacterium]
MAASTLTREGCPELLELLEHLGTAGSDTIKSLIGRELEATPAETVQTQCNDLLETLNGKYVAARGELDKDYAGRALTVLIKTPDAIALSGLLMMTPDDVIQQRRSEGALEEEDAEAFGEVANVLFSGLSGELRERVTNIDLRLGAHGAVDAEDSDGLLPSDSIVAFGFDLQIDEFPMTRAYIVTDVATAERWNGKPLTAETGGGGDNAGDNSGKPDEELFDGIPAAPIQGVLAAFISRPEVYRTLRQSCRRVGLELQRHGKNEIPNPAAHRDQIVLLDIPAGEDKRFDWCKRIKDFAETTKVVLLLHHPSRSRVTQAFLAKADAIAGLPCQEAQLSAKLNALLNAEPSAVPDDGGDGDEDSGQD